jgi:hypothetical protein
MDFGTCRSCKASVRWARSVSTGKSMPLQEAADTGNVVVDGLGRAHVFKDHAAAVQAMENDEFPLGVTFIAHHAVCPDRGRWSRAPSRQDAKGQPEAETLF